MTPSYLSTNRFQFVAQKRVALLVVTLISVVVFIVIIRDGIPDTFWHALLNTFLASLLSICIILLAVSFWIRVRNSPLGKHLNRHKQVILAVLLLALVIPVLMVLFDGTATLLRLAIYVREFVSSVVFVISAAVAVKTIDRLKRKEAATEAAQFLSWEKFLNGNEMGWHELWEEVYFDGRLCDRVRAAVEERLRCVEAGIHHAASHDEQKYAARVELLLLSQSELSKLKSAMAASGNGKASKKAFYMHTNSYLDRLELILTG